MSLLLSLALASPPQRPPVAEAPPEAGEAAPGSLLSPAIEARITDRRAVGALVTVHVDEQTIARVEAQTNTSISSNQSGSVDRAFGLVGKWKQNNTTVVADSGDDGIGYGTTREGDFAGAGDTSRNSSTQAVLTCEVIEVLPGGRLRIWGYKAVTANGETQYLEVSGVVREEDIDLNNVVVSARMAEANIDLTGEGVVDDRQEPGAGTRIIDQLWPF